MTSKNVTKFLKPDFKIIIDDRLISTIVGCNKAIYEQFDKEEVYRGIVYFINIIEKWKEISIFKRTIVLEDGKEYQIQIEATAGIYDFIVHFDKTRLEIEFNRETKKINGSIKPSFLLFLLSVLVYDESEARFLAEAGIQLSKSWNFVDTLPEKEKMVEIIIKDLVRAKKVKLIELNDVQKELVDCLNKNNLFQEIQIEKDLTYLFSEADLLFKRRQYLEKLKKRIISKRSELTEKNYEEIFRNISLSQVELRFDYGSSEDQDWQIGYALLNGIMVMCTDFIAESVASLESKNFGRSARFMVRAADTQWLSADIMKYVGNMSREEYSEETRFKLGGSGGTDHHSHQQLKKYIMKYTKIVHQYLADAVQEYGVNNQNKFLEELNKIQMEAMRNKDFKGHDDRGFIHFNKEQAEEYIKILDKYPNLKIVIDGMLAFKAAHVGIFEEHHQVCGKLVDEEIPSLLGNRISDLRNRIFPIFSILENFRSELK